MNRTSRCRVTTKTHRRCCLPYSRTFDLVTRPTRMELLPVRIRKLQQRGTNFERSYHGGSVQQSYPSHGGCYAGSSSSTCGANSAVQASFALHGLSGFCTSKWPGGSSSAVGLNHATT